MLGEWGGVGSITGSQVLAFSLQWLFERITAINIFAMGWVMTTCAYFALVFPQYLERAEEDGAQLGKPTWID